MKINPILRYAIKYAKRNWPIFPVIPNGKKPVKGVSFHDATTDLEQIREWWSQHPQANIGLATGLASGFFVVDVDKHGDKNGFESIQIIEKLTGKFDTYTVSTPSDGCHYFFKMPAEDVKCKTGIFEGVDIRGSGGYVVGPQSFTHKRYKVINDTVITDAPPLLLAFLKYGKKSIPPVGLSEGNRNDALHRYCCSARSMGMDKNIVLEIALKANKTFSPPMEEPEVFRLLDSAYSYENGKVPLPEGDVKEIMESMNKEYALAMMGGKTVVMRFFQDHETGQNTFEFQGVGDFQTFLRNRKISSGEIQKQMSNIWMDHPERRSYTGIAFAPAGNLPDYIFNMWQGYGVEAKKGNSKRFRRFIREVICAGNKKHYDYLMAWLANAFQNPSNRPGVAVVLYGSQGVGKTFFAEKIGELFGQHYTHVTGIDALTTRFTSMFKDKCLVFIDEAIWEGQPLKAQGILKDRITGDTFIMEAKGVDAIELKNYMQIIMASNERNIVPTSLDERRYLMLHVSDSRKKDTEYFEAVQEHLNNGGYEAFLYYLLHHEYSGIDLRNVPNTEMLQKMKLEQLRGFQAYWFEVLQRGSIIKKGWPNWISKREVRKNYCEHSEIAQDRTVETEVGIELKKLLPGFAKPKKKDGIGGYLLPSLTECRKHFEQVIGIEIDWEE